MADKLVNVTAETITEFMERAVKAVGEGSGEIGDTTYAITPKINFEDDKVKKVSFDVKIEVMRAHWSGGKADARQKKAIETAEALNKAHEEKHRKLAQSICDKMFAAAKKELIGKSQKDVDAKVVEINKAVDKAFKALDAKEGAVEFDDDEAKDKIAIKLVGA